jgi:UDP-N-acetylglucosamine 2-epimerase (non-hydrolysing)
VRVVSVVGARPNFVKLAPVARALAKRQGVEHVVVHTGQHYDPLLSDSFFTELGIPEPAHNLEVGSASHARQTASIMERFEPVCLDLHPDWVLVYGDVNSTVAAALVAAKLGIRVAHVEAGLRSHDRSMPEEYNRVVTDHVADLLFAPSRDAAETLRSEGVPEERIAFVGNVMIDTLVHVRQKARALQTARRLGLPATQFVLVTLHRPSNVDDPTVFGGLCEGLAEIARERSVVFPMHPRSKARLKQGGLATKLGAVRVLDSLPYLAMLDLTESAGLVITDSGGIQEETTFLGVPCLTVRPNTERPITVEQGTNRLVASSGTALVTAARNGIPQRWSPPPRLELWDGRAAERIASVLLARGSS